MRRIQLILTGIFLIVILIFPVNADERIINGGFEDGTTGWSYEGTGFSVLQHRCSDGSSQENSDYAHQGSCYGNPIAGNWKGRTGTIDVYQDIDFTGVSEITFWSAMGDGKSNIMVDSTTILRGIDDPAGGGTWIRHVIPVRYTGIHRLHLTIGSTGGTALKIDGVSAMAGVISPVANFSAHPGQGTSPLSIQFKDTSTGAPVSWLWDFGDGGMSTARNPLHTYPSTGMYIVNLTVTNAAGSDTVTILVLPVNTAERIMNGGFENGTTGWSTTGTGYYVLQYQCPGYNRANSDYAYSGSCWGDIFAGDWRGNTGTIDVYQDIDFTGVSEITFVSSAGDGKTNVLVDSITILQGIDDPAGGGPWTRHTIPVRYTGTHRLHFMIDFTPGTGLHIDEISAVAGLTPPVANFAAFPSTSAPFSVQFTDISTGSPTSWSWDFGDRGTSTVQNPLHQYPSTGTYTVNLTVRNSAGNDTATKTILPVLRA